MSSCSRRWLQTAAGLSLSAVLGACNIGGIGDGNRLETLSIARQTSLLDASSNVSYLCFTDKLQVIGTFTDGGQADYSARATWSSSDPAVVKVSNGDIQLASDPTLAYASGTLVPVATGTATIKVEFVGLSASYDVEVRAPDELYMEQSELTVAPETSAGLTLRASVGGYTLNVTRAAVWSFEAPNDDVATIGIGTGVISAVAPGGPLVATASLDACAGNPIEQDLKAQVNIEYPTALTLEREFVDAPNDELIVGTTESLRVTAQFAGGQTQDLSGLVLLTSDDTAVISPAVLLPQIVTAAAVGTAGVKATYGGDDGNDEEGDTDPPLVESNTVTLNAVERTLDSISIDPVNPTVEALDSQQFEAIGHYDGDTVTQPVTRSVVWASSDTTVATIGTGLFGGGLAVSTKAEDGAVTVTATVGADDDALTDETTLCIVTPGTDPIPECVAPEAR
ncbi:MAG: Ig-like domain-containing protein [Nevskiales bacterium]|nr:Ig-like domain-containing protein [Nevskiales bacterium]